MKQVLAPEAFEGFIHSSIFDNAVFCLGEKQGMLVNDECTVPLRWNLTSECVRLMSNLASARESLACTLCYTGECKRC